MISLGANGNIKTYGMKYFILDEEKDLPEIQTSDLTTGSTAFVIATSAHYMLNSSKKWVKVNLGSSSPGGGGDNPGGGGDTPGEDDNPDVEYDGGDIL